MLQLDICRILLLLAASLLWFGYSPDFFCIILVVLMVSGLGMVGHFLTLQCSYHFRKNENVSDKILWYAVDLGPQGIHTFGVVSSLRLP